MKRILLIVLMLFMCSYAIAAPPNEGGDENGIIRNIDWVINDIWEDNNNAIRVKISSDVGSSLSVDVSIPISFVAGQLTKDAGTTGTAVVLSADTSAVTEIIIRPLPGNRARVFIGPSSTTANSGMGFVLVASQDSLSLRVDSTDDVFMDTDVEGEGISWIGVIR